MARISIEHKHSLSYDEACARLAAAAEQLKARYQLEVTVQGGSVSLSGKGLRGQIVAQLHAIAGATFS